MSHLLLNAEQNKELSAVGLDRSFSTDWYPDGCNAFTARPKLEAYLSRLAMLLKARCR
jgi:hypothetical protein